MEYGALQNIFMLIGIMTTCVAIALALFGMYMYFKELIRYLKLKYKHRFDKLPIEECYCADCIYHDDETGQCYAFKFGNRYTSDNWSCSEAWPVKKSKEII